MKGHPFWQPDETDFIDNGLCVDVPQEPRAGQALASPRWRCPVPERLMNRSVDCILTHVRKPVRAPLPFNVGEPANYEPGSYDYDLEFDVPHGHVEEPVSNLAFEKEQFCADSDAATTLSPRSVPPCSEVEDECDISFEDFIDMYVETVTPGSVPELRPRVSLSTETTQTRSTQRNLGNSKPRRVAFEKILVTSLHEITPYSEIYGLHPLYFNFDDSGKMVETLEEYEC